jgi:hypothetical protein
MSYLDLSDAVTRGDWRRLLDLYWSPGYPVLVGVARLLTGAGAGAEIAVVHAVNFLGFVAMLAGFEYLLRGVLAICVSRSPLSERWGEAIAYGLFAVLAFTMTPLELTTPDLFSDAAILFAFGALLRLQRAAESGARTAIVLGVALGLGALMKSFLIPWAFVCWVILGIAWRKNGVRHIAIAIVAWAVFVVPWSVALSIKAGRPTFGDAGRLTYGWFVNMVDAPSEGGVPPGARTLNTERILPGVGVPGDSPYADPMWADPSRFNLDIIPQFRLSDQLKTLKVFFVFYVQNFAPLLVLVLLVVAAPRGAQRESWRIGWPVYVAAAGGLLAYAMVLVTTRYVMPFVLVITLVLLATIPLARRLVPFKVAIGIAIPIALEVLLPESLPSLATSASIVGGILLAVLIPSLRRPVWMVAALIAFFVVRILLMPGISPGLALVGAILGSVVALALVRPPRLAVWTVIAILTGFVGRLTLASDTILVSAGTIALIVLYWRMAAVAVHDYRPMWFARRTYAALALILVAVLLFRAHSRFEQDRTALERAASPSWGNLQWNIAQDLAGRGIAPGTRIALIGPHAESYWARTARLHIVANVPRNRVAAFWDLPVAAQDSLLAKFRAAGATVAIATVGPQSRQPDSTWTPVKYRGWMRALR